MPDIFATAFIGVKDGSVVPPNRADGRLVNSKRRTILAAKPNGVAIAAGDQLYLGPLRVNERVSEVRIVTDTSLGATTVAVGTKAQTGKYVVATTFTAPINVPANIGPRAVALLAGPVTADEEIWATFAAGGVAGAVVLGFEIDICSHA